MKRLLSSVRKHHSFGLCQCHDKARVALKEISVAKTADLCPENLMNADVYACICVYICVHSFVFGR